MTTSLTTCFLCEACCGLVVEHTGNEIQSIKGDSDDPLSRGYVCPKAVAIQDLQRDPDRVREPLKRVGDRWEPVSWDEALTDIAARVAAIQGRHGRDAVGVYTGNPAIHNFAGVLFAPMLARTLGSKSVFSATSVDGLPRVLTSYLMYGSQAVVPIPDIERTDFMLILGANPVVSNGSVMTAPGAGKRIKAIRSRGGRVVVVDPRRTETAELADAHHFIRPGTDALLLLAMLHTIFAEDLARRGRAPAVDGWDAVEQAARAFSPESVTAAVGIASGDIAQLARDFARAPSAVCYGRMGTCTQELGALASWLVDVLNIVTGNFDRPGGAMFAKAAVDLADAADRIGQRGSFGRWTSRVSGLPEFNGELPVAAFAEEIETPGRGQVRALFTNAGNPVLSLPNGRRLDAAFRTLELMVSVDLYINETTRHAHYILPPTFGLEHDHYPLVFAGLSVRNTAKYSPAILEAPAGVRHDWEIFVELARRISEARDRGVARVKTAVATRAAKVIGPRRVIALLLRMGPYKGMRLRTLLDNLHGVDLGALTSRLPALLRTPDKRIRMAPEQMLGDLARARRMIDASDDGSLRLIGRRSLRSNNSWMHNSARLIKGKPRCTLRMHPADAAERGIADGEQARVQTRVGVVVAPVELSDEVMRGVVSLPHGWGHGRDGARLSVAATQPGVSINDITDDAAVDALSGATNFSGVPVRVSRAVAAARVDEVA